MNDDGKGVLRLFLHEMQYFQNVRWLIVEQAGGDHEDEVWVQFEPQDGSFIRLRIRRDCGVTVTHEHHHIGAQNE
jgi:hypothetical protein